MRKDRLRGKRKRREGEIESRGHEEGRSVGEP